MRPSGILRRIVHTLRSNGFPPWRAATLLDVRPLDPGDVDLWFTGFGDPVADLDLLDCAERTRADAMGDPAARLRFVVARTVLRQLLSRYTGIESADLCIDIEAHGKPVLRRPHELQFNLSHASEGLLIAIAATATIGVDYETPRRITNAARLAERVFSERERAALQVAAGRSQQAHEALFLKLWTRKESLLKARGTGFARAARDSEVLDDVIDDLRLQSFVAPGQGLAAVAMPYEARVRCASVLA